MAKKDLPKGLTNEELDGLKAILNAKRDNEIKLLNLYSSERNLKRLIEETYSSIDGNNAALSKVQEAYQEKYGDVEINVQTGEFVVKEETEE